MLPCPICRSPVAGGAKAAPFCSERCRLLDLGNWLDERYVVPAADDTSAPASDEDDVRGIDPFGGPGRSRLDG